MKFIVNSVSKCGPRLGTFKGIEKLPSAVLETPLPMLYTRGGSIPHITNEVFKLVCINEHIIQIPLQSTYNFQEAMVDFNGTISDFIGMKQAISCVTVQDPGDFTQPGHHVQDSIPLWTRKGKVLINAKSYMNSIEAFKPDMYYFLSDGDTNIASSTKRNNKAVNNTISYFKECLQRHTSSESLKNAFVIGAIAGGYSLKARKDCIKEVCDDKVGGYLIDGLHNNGPEVELQKFSELKPVVECVLGNIPENKLRVVHGCYNPEVIIQLVQLGIDMFDTSYCHIVTERCSALIFSFDLLSDSNEFELNLRSPKCADDFNPILEGCSCLSCTKYSRAYIHHLVSVQELLGPILLTIHNVHHYLKFFEQIRMCIKDGTLNVLHENVAKQFNAYQRIVTKQDKTLDSVEEERASNS